MEPGGEQFHEKGLLVERRDDAKERRKMVSKHPSQLLLLANTLVKSATAIILVYAQEMAGHVPLEI